MQSHKSPCDEGCMAVPIVKSLLANKQQKNFCTCSCKIQIKESLIFENFAVFYIT